MDKLTKIVLSILGVLISLVILLVIVLNLPKNNKVDDEYDISMFHEVRVEDILGMFEDGGTYVVMVGSKRCDVCARLLPKMAEAQKELNYITQYLDIFSINFDGNAWKALAQKLNMKSTQAISENQSGRQETNTYGYFIENYMMAPTVFIIKDGKQTGGFIGGVDTTDLIGWLSIKLAN